MCAEIDAVVTWVDSSSLEWQAARETYAQAEKDAYFSPPAAPDAELDLCISLILQNLPWLRYIWLVTMRPQKPACLSKPGFREKVKVIHHDDFFTTTTVPTFNSFAIEANLWKIKGLSERFVYFNDDFYVLRPAPLDLFFRSEKPIVWVSKTVPAAWQHSDNVWKKAWSHLYALFKGTRLLYHIPLCLTKTMMKKAAEHFEMPWSHTCQSQVRAPDNIPTIGAAINLAIRDGAVVVEPSPKVLFREAVRKPKTVEALLAKGAVFLCVNRQPFEKTRSFCDEMQSHLLAKRLAGACGESSDDAAPRPI